MDRRLIVCFGVKYSQLLELEGLLLKIIQVCQHKQIMLVFQDCYKLQEIEVYYKQIVS